MNVVTGACVFPNETFVSEHFLDETPPIVFPDKFTKNAQVIYYILDLLLRKYRAQMVPCSLKKCYPLVDF